MVLTKLAIVVGAVALVAPPQGSTPLPTPEALLAKAAAAFEQNRQQDKFWNKTSRESWYVSDNRGFVVQRFPAVVTESVLRQDGTRCNAVVEWADAVPAYLRNGPEDSRCHAVDESTSEKFDVAALLANRRVQRKRGSSSNLELTVFEQSRRGRSNDPLLRCAAAIRANIRLDEATFFPLRLDGEVMDDGCDERLTAPPTYYGARPVMGPVSSTFRMGSTFRYEYQPQDRFGSADTKFWLLTHWSYDQPVNWTLGNILIYWGRQVPYRSPIHGDRLIVNVDVTGEQFGVTSKVVIKK